MIDDSVTIDDSVRLWESQPLPPAIQAPVPPPNSWIGSVAEAAAFAGTAGAFVARGSTPGTARDYGLTLGTPVIVLLVDGLGAGALADNLAYAPTLRRLPALRGSAQTCAPSTTAAALTSFATGALPGQTQMVGYSVRRGETVMNLLKFAPGVDGLAWQREETLFERMGKGFSSVVVTDPKFSRSGLTRAAMRGARFIGAHTLEDRLSVAAREAREGTALTYVYWAALDKAGHKFGPKSSQWRAALEDLDRALAELLRAVDGRAQVMLTADHGMVQVGTRTDLACEDALARGVEMIAGEGRAVHVHAQPGTALAVEGRWREELSDRAWVFNRAQIPLVIGTGPGCALIGDLLVMPKGAEVIVDSRTQSASSIAMPGVHGSLTPEEMLIPVWRLL